MAKWLARAVLAGAALIIFYLWLQLNLAAKYAINHAVPSAVDQNQHDGQTMILVFTFLVDIGLLVVALLFIVPLIGRFGGWLWRTAELRPTDRNRGA